MKLNVLMTTLIPFLFLDASAQSGETGQKKKGDAKEENKKKDPWNSGTFNGLAFRNIGTAKTSGRVVDFAVNPYSHKEYYVAAASSGVWKTTNGGITYNPVFDGEGSYSIG